MQKKIYLAGGCFWGTEKYLSLIPGVTSTLAGYANGATENPLYEDVRSQKTGHAETVEVEYESDILPLDELLARFYRAIDPVAVNRQGEDEGTQYRTGIYYVDSGDRAVIEQSLRELQMRYAEPLALEVKPLENFYRAEDFHQNYLGKNPGGYCHIGKAFFEAAREPIRKH